MSRIQEGWVTIGHSEAERLNIEVVSREPDGWRVANVEVTCGIWKGTFRWQFYEGELRRFAGDLKALYETLTGTATLDPLEPNLRIKVVGDGRGHLLIEGRAEAEFYKGTYLVFSLALDQTELPAIAAALVAADPA